MRKRRFISVALATLGIAVIASVGAAMSARATEEPPHEVLKRAGAFEIRAYDPMIRAEISVTASDRGAGNAGFRPLAKYIFGGNTAQQKIEMTTPVMQNQAVPASSKIEMTAPVMQQRGRDAGQYTVAFVMPAEWTMETLPVPDDARVTLQELPAQTMAIVRFNGLAGPDKRARKTAALNAWIARSGYEAAGVPISAFYDPPWTLPPFRRNEIMIPVVTRSGSEG